MCPIKKPKRWLYAFINTNQIMATLDHCPKTWSNGIVQSIGENIQMVPRHIDLVHDKIKSNCHGT
jgi:hypothetical protein